MRLTPLALLTLMGLSVAGNAHAQQIAPPAITAQRSTVFGVDLTARHDSNTTGGGTSAATSRGLSPADWVYEPTANVAIVEPIGRQAVFLNGFVGYDYHDKNTQLNRGRANLMGGGLVSTGPCNTTLAGGYTAAQSELSDTTLAIVSNLLTTKAEIVSATCGRTTGFDGQIAAQHVETTNSASIQKLADHSSDLVSLMLGYRNPTLGNLGVIGSYARQDFPNRPIVTAGLITGAGDGYSSYSVGLSYQRKIGSRITAALTGAETNVKRDTAPVGTAKDFSSFTYSGELTYQLGSRITLTASLSHSILPSNRPGKLYDTVSKAEGAVGYKLGSRFDVALGALRNEVRSNTDTTISDLVVTNSTLISIYGSVVYHQSPKTSLEFQVRHLEKTANIAVFGYDNTEIVVSLHKTF